jgi:adenosylcobinamide kinase/adenosylcobinamide-phosphate guanylyltransferase
VSALRVGDVTCCPDGVRCGGGPLVPLAAGEAVRHGGVRIVALPAGPDGGPGEARPVLVVASPASGTVLWAPGGGPLPRLALDALAGAGLDVAALALGTGGDRLARTLAQLRRVDALSTECDVIAVQVPHGTVPAALSARLVEWGARLAPDGAAIAPGGAARPPERPPRTLVLGASSSGKSALAEALLAADPDVDYLPTGLAPSAADPEWTARVEAHRRRRPPWWRTLDGETPFQALAVPGAPLLIDSVGSWVAGVLDRCGAWDDRAGWRDALGAEVEAMVRAWCQTRRQVVAVAEETGWGVVPASASGRRFRDTLGTVNARLAAESERVLLVVAGRAVPLPDGGEGLTRRNR